MRRFALAPSPDNFGTVPMIAGEGTSPDSDSPLDVATLEELANCPENRLLLWSYRDWLARGNRELPAERLFDASVGHYLMHPDAPGHDPERILGRSAEGPEDLFRIEDVFVASPYREDLARLMGEVDLPLVPVLVEMERRGIAADGAALERLDRDLDLRIRRIEGEVAQKAGVEINLNSPKQVAGLLYERLGLPSLRKTKIGKAPSTDARTLEELAGLPEPTSLVPKLLVEHREIAKIRSGFVRPFLALSMGGARIHSTFDATATGTGRLASRDPNVQNLPVFGDWAHRFRSCLVAPEGYCFVAADYSQIELRVLAWLSGEERLVEAFARNEDVHARTASWIFGVEPDDVSGEQRRFAKVVNFGLLYGMGAHGLAERMGTDRTRAQQLVDRYFGVLPRVRDYLHRSVVEAKERGYARSPFGRIRPLAEVVTVEGRGPGAIERVAVNTPIQSAAADLAKVAMIRFRRVISEICPEAGLVLQVHDSLVVECPETRADEVERLLVETMEGVGMIPVPLRADPKRGRTLAEI
jgi:DNA polymerase-1